MPGLLLTLMCAFLFSANYTEAGEPHAVRQDASEQATGSTDGKLLEEKEEHPIDRAVRIYMDAETTQKIIKKLLRSNIDPHTVVHFENADTLRDLIELSRISYAILKNRIVELYPYLYCTGKTAVNITHRKDFFDVFTQRTEEEINKRIAFKKLMHYGLIKHMQRHGYEFDPDRVKSLEKDLSPEQRERAQTDDLINWHYPASPRQMISYLNCAQELNWDSDYAQRKYLD